MKKISWILIISVLSLVGCQNLTSQHPNITETSISFSATVSSPMHTEETHLVMSPTATPTPVLNAILTVTPHPTLTLEQNNKIMQLMKTNDNCTLPCWWGIIPGISRWDEISNVKSLSSISGYREDKIQPSLASAYLYVQRPESSSPDQLYIKPSFQLINGVIQSIRVLGTETSSAYSLRNIFTNNNKPSEIWMTTFNQYPNNNPPMEIFLFYPEQGILLEYAAEGEIKDKNVYGCFDIAGGIYLWDQSSKINGICGCHEIFRVRV
ncbi:MAG: hypothetical protein QM730_02510 [Anaerolineales bacterium]